MICKSFAAIGALTLPSAASAHAESPPKDLYGKSIAVQWSETITGRMGGDQTMRNWLMAYLMNIYVSSAGRSFVQVKAGGPGNGEKRFGAHGGGDQGFSASPDQASSGRVDFQGKSIFVYRELASGASRVAIDLDGAGCKATVIIGRQGGKNIVRQSGGAGQADISSVQVGTVSCSIREGNVFGQ